MIYYSICICFLYCFLKFNNVVITLKINNIHKSFYHNYNNNYYYNNINKINHFYNININSNSNFIKRKNVILNLSYELRPHNTLDTNYIINKNNNNGMKSLILDDFNQILEAISIFIEIYGDSNIPNKFEIPAELPWPSSLHGLRLGLLIYLYLSFHLSIFYLYLSLYKLIYFSLYFSILYLSTISMHLLYHPLILRLNKSIYAYIYQCIYYYHQ